MAESDRTVVNDILYDEAGNGALVDATGATYATSLGVAVAHGRVPGVVAIVGGYVGTSAVTTVPLRATAYTELATAQQLQLKSSSANDTAAGTGARTVRITYYDGTMAGPNVEVVTMNGTSTVNTVGTNLCYVEKLEVVTAGSTSSNVGTVTLQTLAPVTVGTIAASDGQTFWAHHYVAAGRTCFVKRIMLGTNGVSCGALVRLASPLTPNAFELQIGSQLRVVTAQPSQVYDVEDLPLVGPARVTLYVKPDALTANTTFGSVIFYEV